MSPTRAEIEARLEQIDQKKAATLKALKERRQKLKAKLAALERPSKAERRLDARRKILLGAFVLEQLEQAGQSPQAFTLEGERFFDWLVRPNDRAVFDLPSPRRARRRPLPAPPRTRRPSTFPMPTRTRPKHSAPAGMPIRSAGSSQLGATSPRSAPGCPRSSPAGDGPRPPGSATFLGAAAAPSAPG